MLNIQKSIAEKLFDIVNQKGSKLPFYVMGIRSEPNYKKILQSNFDFKNRNCFLTLDSYTGSHSISVRAEGCLGDKEFSEIVYVDGEKKEFEEPYLKELIEYFIENINSGKLSELY